LFTSGYLFISTTVKICRPIILFYNNVIARL
jgi:hypothetical protein